MTHAEGSHFNQRCRERGIVTTDLAKLHAGLRWAIQNGRQDLVRFVMTLEDVDYWRFSCPDGLFYCLTKHGHSNPMTVMTQEMMRHKKWVRKHRCKRGGGKPGKVVKRKWRGK